MEATLLKSTNHEFKKNGAINIHQWYDKKANDLPFTKGFQNLLSINNREFQPNMGILPQTIQEKDVITVLLKGTLIHKNNRGETFSLKPGDVQLIKAGSGLSFFEYNKSTTCTLQYIQICLSSKTKTMEPSITINSFEANKIGFQNIFNDEGIQKKSTCQNIHYYYAFFEENMTKTYFKKNKHTGVAILNLGGTVQINNKILKEKDILLINKQSKIEINSRKESRLFVIDL